jgi:hypothetical protein
MSQETQLIEDAIILIHQMKNEFLGEFPDHCTLANEVIATLRKIGPRVDKEKEVLGMINFQLVRLAVCIPEEFDDNELANKFKDKVQDLCGCYDGGLNSEDTE